MAPPTHQENAAYHASSFTRWEIPWDHGDAAQELAPLPEPAPLVESAQETVSGTPIQATNDDDDDPEMPDLSDRGDEFSDDEDEDEEAS